MSSREWLEYLRGELRAERISWGELAELQALADLIEPGDVELLEAAGVPEFPDSGTPARVKVPPSAFPTALKGARVVSAEVSAGYIVLRFDNGATLYADAPALYSDSPTSQEVTR